MGEPTVRRKLRGRRMKQRTPLRPMSAKRIAAQAQERAQPRQRTYPKRSSMEPRRAVLGRVEAKPSPDPKGAKPMQSPAYREIVASLPCKYCGIAGFSQAAHPSTGRGGAEKTDDRRVFPLCCARPGIVGCHTAFDQQALFTKEARRIIEDVWAADTRRQVIAMGKWPAKLPAWIESTEGEK